MSHLHIAERRYDALIGVGGIGWGTFFAVRGDRPLGREESRSGQFLDRQDFCKLHIIAHYVQTLLGPGLETIPVGRVGEDGIGAQLVNQMEEAGMNVHYVACSPGERTLYSFCLVYPDGTGGNLTTDNSACSTVTAATVSEAEPEFGRFEGRGLALAAPEVPLAARERLLELGTEYGFFRAAAFTSEEVQPAIERGLLSRVDLLALNLDEAAAAAAVSPAGRPAEVVEATVAALTPANPGLLISVTAGPSGSWVWDGSALHHVPKLGAEVQSTAGAGDAHLAGVLVGLTAGLPLAQAAELGALVAALSVTSVHTIHPDISRDSLRRFAATTGAPLSDAVRELLAGEGQEEE